jgi:hypothetical protein
VGRVSDAVRRSLPAPVVRRVGRLRAAAAQGLAGPEIEARLAGMAAELRAEMAAAHQQTLRHLEALDGQAHARDEELLADLLARQDAVLAGYDRRVATLVVRVLDLQEQVRNGSRGLSAGAAGVDVTGLLDAHHPQGS